jgi:hypothetical protein
MSVYPRREAFAAGIGSRFTTSIDDSPVEFVLDAVREGVESGQHVRFSLEFTATGDPLPQRTYTLENEALGAHDIFLVPIGREGERTRYEAVFNVAKESEG